MGLPCIVYGRDNIDSNGLQMLHDILPKYVYLSVCVWVSDIILRVYMEICTVDEGHEDPRETQITSRQSALNSPCDFFS